MNDQRTEQRRYCAKENGRHELIDLARNRITPGPNVRIGVPPQKHVVKNETNNSANYIWQSWTTRTKKRNDDAKGDRNANFRREAYHELN